MCKGCADVVGCAAPHWGTANVPSCTLSGCAMFFCRSPVFPADVGPLASRHLGSALALLCMLLSEYRWMRFAPPALLCIRPARVHVSPSCICLMISLCCVLSLSSGLSYAHFPPIRSHIHLRPWHCPRTSPPHTSPISALPLPVPPSLLLFSVPFPAPLMCLIQRQQQHSLDPDYSRLRIISSCPPRPLNRARARAPHTVLLLVCI